MGHVGVGWGGVGHAGVGWACRGVVGVGHVGVGWLVYSHRGIYTKLFMSHSNSKNNNSLGFEKFTNGYKGMCMSRGKVSQTMTSDR